MQRKPYSSTEILRIVRLRMAYKPLEIAGMTGRTESAIVRILSLEKRRTGITYPKLRHGNLKYDKQLASRIRLKIKQGMKYKQIRELDGLHLSQISRTLAADARSELM